MTAFVIKDEFYLNDQPMKIISGSIHYFRVVPAYWRDRLEKLRLMGCNTVETYVPWRCMNRRKESLTLAIILICGALFSLHRR